VVAAALLSVDKRNVMRQSDILDIWHGIKVCIRSLRCRDV